jgi:hypothetical protein
VIKNELYALTYSIFFPKTSEETEQILSFDQYICPDTGSKTLLRIGSAFIPINEIYLKQLHEYYLKISKDMISLNLIQDTHDEKMLFNHLLDNTDQGWIKVGISALKNGITQDYSNKHLSQLLRRMKYINRIK